MPPRAPPPALVHRAVLLMDVVGSAGLWRGHPQAMMAMLDRLTPATLRAARAHQGTVIKMIGDAFMIAFHDVAAAVRFAAHVQLQLLPALGGALTMRIGIAQGPVHPRVLVIQGCKQQDYFGEVVNLAARAENAVSPPGGLALALGQGLTTLAARRLVNPHARRVALVSWEEEPRPPQAQALAGGRRLVSLRSETRTTSSLRGVAPVQMLRVWF